MKYWSQGFPVGQNAQSRPEDRSLPHKRPGSPLLCLPAANPLLPGASLPPLSPPDQPLTAASTGQENTMWACGYPQCSLQVIIKPLHLVTMRWIKSTKMNPPGLRRRAVLLCFLARSNWSSVGGWREIQNFFKRLICKRLFRWYMFQKQMTCFGLFRYQGSYLLKQPIITHFELVDPSRQVVYISQMYISLCLVALISHLCKLAYWPNF